MIRKLGLAVLTVAGVFLLTGYERNGVGTPAFADLKKEAKAETKTLTGTIEELDATAGTFSVKRKKDTLRLKAPKNVKLDVFRKGDQVTVTHTGDTASKIVAAKKGPKKDAPPKRKAGTHETSRELWEKGLNEGPGRNRDLVE